MKASLIYLCLLSAQTRAFLPRPQGRSDVVALASSHMEGNAFGRGRRKLMKSLIAGGLTFLPTAAQAKV